MMKKTSDGLAGPFDYCDYCEVYWAQWKLPSGKVICDECKNILKG